MKALLLPLLFPLTALLPGAASAQTTPPAPAAPKPAKVIREQTADRRAANYQGPKVVKDSKKLGREMLKDSKPAPAPLVAPVKQ